MKRKGRDGRPAATHERLTDDGETRGPADRALGFAFAALFLIIGGRPWLSGAPARRWALAVSAVLLLAAAFAPRLLAPLGRGWLWLSRRLQRVTNPVLMAIVFFGTLTPLGLLLRALGQDPLRLRRDPAATTYWIDRHPPGPAPATMPRQF